MRAVASSTAPRASSKDLYGSDLRISAEHLDSAPTLASTFLLMESTTASTSCPSNTSLRPPGDSVSATQSDLSLVTCASMSAMRSHRDS